MPIEIENESDGVVVIRVVGKLVKEDYARFTPRFEQVARERGELRVLFDMTRLEGWDAGGLWEETKFDIQHYSAIGRMAAIGDEKWHHALMSAVKPLAHAKVRYFHQGETEQARAWLLTPEK